MKNMLFQIISEYSKWRKNWDDLCGRCGLCCYSRSLSRKGEVVVDLIAPCEFLNKETRLCRVFENRFRRCAYCSSVNIFRALFHPLLPSSCAYVKTFRPWRKKANR